MYTHIHILFPSSHTMNPILFLLHPFCFVLFIMDLSTKKKLSRTPEYGCVRVTLIKQTISKPSKNFDLNRVVYNLEVSNYFIKYLQKS